MHGVGVGVGLGEHSFEIKVRVRGWVESRNVREKPRFVRIMRVCMKLLSVRVFLADTLFSEKARFVLFSRAVSKRRIAPTLPLIQNHEVSGVTAVLSMLKYAHNLLRKLHWQ